MVLSAYFSVVRGQAGPHVFKQRLRGAMALDGAKSSDLVDVYFFVLIHGRRNQHFLNTFDLS